MSATRAANPDTPAEQLAQLAAQFPQQVLDNPVLPLLLLEQPDWLAQLPETSLLALVGGPEMPATLEPMLLRAAATHPAPLLRLAMAGRADLPAELLQQLQHDPDPHVNNAAHCHPRAVVPTDLPTAVRASLRLGLPPTTPLTAPHIVALLEELARTKLGADDAAGWLAEVLEDPERQGFLRQAAMLRDPCTSFPVLKKALGHELPAWLLRAIGQRPDLTGEMLHELAQHGRKHLPKELALLQGIASNPLAPPEVLQFLLEIPESEQFDKDTHKDSSLLLALAANARLHTEQLAEVVARTARTCYAPYSAWENVLLNVARNPAAPPALLVWIYLHYPSDDALTYQYGHRRLSEWLPQALQFPRREVGGHDAEISVLPPAAELRKMLLASPLVPAGLRTLLAGANGLPDLPDHYFPHYNPEQMVLRQLLAANPAAPPALLDALADDASLAVRTLVARHPAAPPAALRRLAADRALSVARLALRHPAHPARHDPAEATAAFEAADPATPPARLAQLARERPTPVRVLVAENPATPAEALTQLAQDKIIEVRAAVAAHPATPEAVLEALAADKASLVVREVAGNLAAPPALLDRLAASKDKFVRRLAIQNPHLPEAAIPKLLRDGSLKNRLLLLHQPLGRQRLLQAAADKDPTTRLLLQLALPEYLTAAHRAALAASPYPAHRLSVAHLPEFQAQLRLDAHLLVRTVAGA